jgi:hypothetical protein
VAAKPSPFDRLEEATFNAALAIIDSMQCRSELEALMAVEIVATGFSGLRFLRQSHKNMTEEYVSVYGNYANKLEASARSDPSPRPTSARSQAGR